MELEAFYYDQDEEFVCVIIIDYEKHLAHKIMNVKKEECKAPEFVYISQKSANMLISGLNKAYFSIDAVKKEGDINESTKKVLDFMVAIQKKYSNPDYWNVIKTEYELSDIMKQKTIKYWDLVDKSEFYMMQSNLKEFEDFILKNGAREDLTELEKQSLIANLMLHENENGFAEIRENLKKDKNHVNFLELQPKIQAAFFELMESSIKLVEHFEKEYNLFSEEYLKRIDDFADEGLFLYFMNTPDWPLEDEKYSIDDILNYELFEGGIHLWEIISQYIENIEMGDI